MNAPLKIEPAIEAMTQDNPSFGYRMVVGLLSFNNSTGQRVFHSKGWQLRKRRVGSRPWIEASLSVAEAPNERWSIDMARVWTGKHGWATLAMDFHTRELLGWQLSRCGKASIGAAALETGSSFAITSARTRRRT